MHGCLLEQFRFAFLLSYIVSWWAAAFLGIAQVRSQHRLDGGVLFSMCMLFCFSKDGGRDEIHRWAHARCVEDISCSFLHMFCTSQSD